MKKTEIINKIKMDISEEVKKSSIVEFKEWLMKMSKKDLRDIERGSRKKEVEVYRHGSWGRDVALLPNGWLEDLEAWRDEDEEVEIYTTPCVESSSEDEESIIIE